MQSPSSRLHTICTNTCVASQVNVSVESEGGLFAPRNFTSLAAIIDDSNNSRVWGRFTA